MAVQGVFFFVAFGEGGVGLTGYGSGADCGVGGPAFVSDAACVSTFGGGDGCEPKYQAAPKIRITMSTTAHLISSLTHAF